MLKGLSYLITSCQVWSPVNCHCFGLGLTISWWIAAIMAPPPKLTSFFFLFPAPVYSPHHWIFSVMQTWSCYSSLSNSLLVPFAYRIIQNKTQLYLLLPLPTSFFKKICVGNFYLFFKSSLSHPLCCSFRFPETAIIIPSSLLPCPYLCFAPITLHNPG